MKEQALALVRGIDDPGLAVNRLREYLQCLVLRTLHESEAFTSMAFFGGTALRFLHDLPRFSEDLHFSLLGKIAAVLTRKYTKGRDWYDLAWYLSHRPPVAPNLELLGRALEQARGGGHGDAGGWPSLVRERLAALDVDTVARDVRPFLERPKEARLLTRENLAGLLPRS